MPQKGRRAKIGGLYRTGWGFDDPLIPIDEIRSRESEKNTILIGVSFKLLDMIVYGKVEDSNPMEVKFLLHVRWMTKLKESFVSYLSDPNREHLLVGNYYTVMGTSKSLLFCNMIIPRIEVLVKWDVSSFINEAMQNQQKFEIPELVVEYNDPLPDSKGGFLILTFINDVYIKSSERIEIDIDSYRYCSFCNRFYCSDIDKWIPNEIKKYTGLREEEAREIILDTLKFCHVCGRNEVIPIFDMRTPIYRVEIDQKSIITREPLSVGDRFTGCILYTVMNTENSECIHFYHSNLIRVNH
jgi:hypothetical protein